MKGFQHMLEIMQILLPFALIAFGFGVIMMMTYQLQATVGAAFIPQKVASSIAHSLTGNPDCLMYDVDGYKVKGVIDQKRVDLFASEFSEDQPNCTKIPCWAWRAVVTDFEEKKNYTFGNNSTDDDTWENGACVVEGKIYSTIVCVLVESKDICFIEGRPTASASVAGTLAAMGVTIPDLVILKVDSIFCPDVEVKMINPAKKTINIPVVIQTEDGKHLGKIKVQAAQKDTDTCSEDITRILKEYAEVT